jgi:cold shock CspA family protein
MIEGIVVFFLPDRDYGYVSVLDTREEFYFRGRNCQTPVRAGDRVRFRLCEGKQGYYADELQNASNV